MHPAGVIDQAAAIVGSDLGPATVDQLLGWITDQGGAVMVVSGEAAVVVSVLLGPCAHRLTAGTVLHALSDLVVRIWEDLP